MNKADILFKENIHQILQGYTDINPMGIKPRGRYQSDGAPAHTYYITQVFEKYDLTKGEFPLTTLRPVAINNGIKEIFWIYQDQSNDIDFLEARYGIDWWRPWAVKTRKVTAHGYIEVDNTIGQRYGATVERYDLMNKLLKGLKENPFGRRHKINLDQEADMQEIGGLDPCAFLSLYTPRLSGGDLYLDATLVQRSSDYLVAGHINKMQYVALQMMIAHEVGMKVGTFAHLVQNLHVYDRHLEQAKELVSRPVSEETPRLVLNAEGKGFYDITLSDFTLENYHPTKPNMKFDLGI